MLKRILSKLIRAIGLENKEHVYYENLFIKNPDWNSKTPNHEESLRWAIIEGFVKNVRVTGVNEQLNILDLGCGRGWLANLLSDYGKVTGIEPVKEVIKYAKKLFPDLGLKQGTAKDLYNDYTSSFDVVVSSEVIEHIPDKKKNDFLNDIYTLLKPEGYAIITTPRKEAEEEWKKHSAPNQPIEDWLSEKDLGRLFETAGFKEVKRERYSVSPSAHGPEIEIYQLWLVQKK